MHQSAEPSEMLVGQDRDGGSGSRLNASDRPRAGTDPPTPGQLRAFVLLAEELHFGRAARRLGIASSTMSETLNRLESCVGGELVRRSSRRVALTERGERLLPRAVEVLRRLDALTEIDDPATTTIQPTLRIRLGGAAWGDLTQPVLEAFRARHPRLRLDLNESGTVRGPAADDTWDLMVTHVPHPGQGVEIHRIATEPRVMLMPAQHPAAGRDGVTLHDFREDPHIAFAPWAPPIRDYWLGVRERGGVRPPVGGVAYTVADVVHQVRCLGLVAMVPRSLASTVLLPGITSVPLDDVAPCVMAVVTHSGRDDALVADFVAVSRQVARRRQSRDRVFGATPLQRAV